MGPKNSPAMLDPLTVVRTHLAACREAVELHRHAHVLRWYLDDVSALLALVEALQGELARLTPEEKEPSSHPPLGAPHSS